jgi:hypothetical protein
MPPGGVLRSPLPGLPTPTGLCNMRPMLPRRTRTHASQVGLGLALLASALLIVAATPWSSARAAEDNEAPKAAVPDAPQVEDVDKHKDKSLLAQTPADAAVAKKNAGGDDAFYQRWQFWAVTGGIAVGLVAAIWGSITLYHSLNGGDVRPCNPSFIRCYGQGEPNP